MLVGFAGYAKSGKDTSCEILQHHGLIGKRHAFADPIKQTCNALFNWDDRHAFGELKEVEGETPMSLLAQNFNAFAEKIKFYGLDNWGMGSNSIYGELMKHLSVSDGVDPHVYTSPREVYQIFGTEVGREKLHTDIWVLSAPTEDVCIPDVRFHNECDYLKTKGATVIRINRGTCTPVRPHASESYITELNVTDEYDNDGTLYDLESWIMNYFNINPNSPRLYPDE